MAAVLVSAIALALPANAQSTDAQSSDAAASTVATSAPAATRSYERFISGDYIFAPNASNEFAGNTNHVGPSFAGRAVGEFPIGNIPIMVEANAEQFSYPHPAGAVTNLGGRTSSFVPSSTLQDRDLDARLGVGFSVMNVRLYVGGSYIWLNNSYGYPPLNGAGFGIEKLPNLERSLSAFGDYYFYPQVTGTYADPVLGAQTLNYRFQKYEAGLAYSFALPSTALRPFVEAGWRGTYAAASLNAPLDRHAEGPFLGVGLKL